MNSYTITASAGEGGSIVPAGQVTVDGGGSQSFTITADSGYETETVMIDGQDVGVVSSYTFDQLAANHTISVIFTELNQLPVADAGPDQSVDEAEVVTLSGLNSMDADDGIAGFAWRQIQGTTVELSDPTSAETTFAAPDVDVEGQALVFELHVTDHSGATSVDSCIVNVSWVNEAPTAQAGADQSVMEGELVTLDAGNSVDADNGIATYAWRQLQGPVVTLSDGSAVRPTFTAPGVEMQGASMLFELTVTDGGGLQDTDQCIVTVELEQRTAGGRCRTGSAGPRGPGGLPERFQLHRHRTTALPPTSGGRPTGHPVALSDATAVQPSFFAPDVVADGVALTFQLTVDRQRRPAAQRHLYGERLLAERSADGLRRPGPDGQRG